MHAILLKTKGCHFSWYSFLPFVLLWSISLPNGF